MKNITINNVNMIASTKNIQTHFNRATICLICGIQFIS